MIDKVKKMSLLVAVVWLAAVLVAVFLVVWNVVDVQTAKEAVLKSFYSLAAVWAVSCVVVFLVSNGGRGKK